MNIKIGTRASQLALWQANHIADLLAAAGLDSEIIPINTKGDKILNVSIAKIGSKGVFTEEIEQALAEGVIDIAVHSAKDMPSVLPEGFSLIAFTEREKVNDVIVSHHADFDWDEGRKSHILGTSSTRRVATFKHYYPTIKTVNIRGNLQTRIQKMQDGLCDAIVLAYAGVHRMEYDELIRHELPLTQFIPAVGQGSIAIEVHASLSDDKKQQIKAATNHHMTEIALLAERSFLRKLQGGCSIPAFAYAEFSGNQLIISGGIVSLDGQAMIRHQMQDSPENALNLGEKLGHHVLINGGDEILKSIKQS